MFNHRPGIVELHEEMKSLDKNTLYRIIRAAEEELHRRQEKINKEKGITIEEMKVTIVDDGQLEGELKRSERFYKK